MAPTIDPKRIAEQPPISTGTPAAVPAGTPQKVIISGTEPEPQVLARRAPDTGMTRGVGRMWGATQSELPLNIGKYSAEQALIRLEELDPPTADLDSSFSARHLG